MHVKEFKMVALIKQWMMYKELIALSLKLNFRDIDADKVIAILERFALSRLGGNDPATKAYAALVFSRKELQRAPQHKDALIKIWELAKERYQQDLPNRPKWHRVMACCNSLYEPYSKMLKHEEDEAIAA